MGYVSGLGDCAICGEVRKDMATLPELRRKDGVFVSVMKPCCRDCYDWMLKRGYPLAEMLEYANSETWLAIR